MTVQEFGKCGAAVSVANFWADSKCCFGEFNGVFKHFEDLKNLTFKILKCLALWVLAS